MNLFPTGAAKRMSDEAKLQKELDKKNGVIRLKPNLVPQAYPGLNRIGVMNSRLGRLGYASERWIACCVRRLRRLSSEPKSSNAGLSVIHLETSRHDMLLGDAFDLFPARMLGRNFESKRKYARIHAGDIGCRLPDLLTHPSAKGRILLFSTAPHSIWATSLLTLRIAPWNQTISCARMSQTLE